MTPQHKIAALEAVFTPLTSAEAIYDQIIAWGKRLVPFDSREKCEANRVFGCQSLMYLKGELRDDKIFFTADSDALISKGLAALLIFLYNGESPETVIKAPPTCLSTLGVLTSLSPGRLNGFASLYQKMQTIALGLTLHNQLSS